MKRVSDENITIVEKRVGSLVAEEPLISVIIPVYNCSHFIAESLCSVLGQAFDSFEVIVVNDGSDDTPQLLQNLDPFLEKITYLERTNGGPGAARNTGINVARGQFLGFVDGDDIWKPEFLKKQYAALLEKNCDLIYCDAHLFGKVSDENSKFSDKSPSTGPVTTEALISGRCNVILSGTFVKKAPVLKYGMFTETGLPMAIEDYELWFRLCKNGVKIDYQREILLSYRVHESNISGGLLKIVERGLVGMKYLRENFELTSAELEAVSHREREIRSQFLLEKAKICLAQKEFGRSLALLSEGREESNSFKIFMIESLMKISPSVARWLFRSFRRKEFDLALEQQLSIQP